MFLETGLHENMVTPGDVKRSFKEREELLGQPVEILHRSGLMDMGSDLFSLLCPLVTGIPHTGKGVDKRFLKTGLTMTKVFPTVFFRVYAKEKIGSIPLEHPARSEIVPVGATVVIAALRTVKSFQVLPFHAGNVPFASASLCDSATAVSVTIFMTCSHHDLPSVES